MRGTHTNRMHAFRRAQEASQERNAVVRKHASTERPWREEEPHGEDMSGEVGS
ncbi:hypothetical protein GCM10027408_20400 [Microbacterium tumbae]